MILAGGTGKELSVLTRHRAKTALPFGGRYRIIDFCLSNCVHSGLTDIAVLAQYSPKSLMEHIRMGKPWDLDRKTGGVYILQPTFNGEVAKWYLGTADALFQNEELINNSEAEHVIVLSGDQVYLMDYGRLLDHHISSGKRVTLACKKVPARHSGRYGMIKLSGGMISEFMEKPRLSRLSYASLGIYVFDRKYLARALGSSKKDIVFDILMPAIKKKSVAGFVFEDYWEDIGSIPSYYKASMKLLKQRSIITRTDWPVFTRGEGLPPAKFSRSSQALGSIVADGCVVRGRVKGSILFPGVVVDEDAVVEDSIIFSYSRVRKGARIKHSILDKETAVGEGASIGCSGRPWKKMFEELRDTEAEKAAGRISVIGKSSEVAQGMNVPPGMLIEPGSDLR